MNKYEELYRLAKDLVEQTEARFDTIDDKAANYLSVLTLLVGAAAFFIKWVTDTLIPPQQPLQWLLCVVAVAVTLCVVTAWWLVFRVLRIHKIKMPPLNDEMIRFFDEHDETDIYYALAKEYKGAWEDNQAVNNAKLRDLAIGYRMIIITGSLLLVFATLYAVYVWTK